MKQMQGMDAAFVALEQDHAPVHVGSILIYDPSTAPDGVVRHKDILQFLERRLHLAPIMRQRMVRPPLNIDYPYWVNDSNFDLEYHVRHVALPHPQDWRQLCILAARNFARPLDLKRPLWEFLIVEGLDNVKGVPKGSYAILTKIHHAAVDGASGTDIMHALHKLDPSLEDAPENDQWRPERLPGQVGMFARGYFRALTLPARQVSTSLRTAPGMLRAARGAIAGDFDILGALKTPRTRFNGTVSPHRVIDAISMPLAEIKRLRKLVEDATVNDVILSIVGGAMRAYLIEKNELPEASLSAMAPISVRTEKKKTPWAIRCLPCVCCSERLSKIPWSGCNTFMTKFKSRRR